MAETTDELLARMAAKYGLPNQQEQRQPQRPAPPPQQPVQQPQAQQPRNVVDAMRNRTRDIDRAAGYADGGYIDDNEPMTAAYRRANAALLPDRTGLSSNIGEYRFDPNFGSGVRDALSGFQQRLQQGPGYNPDRNENYGNEGRGASALAPSSRSGGGSLTGAPSFGGGASSTFEQRMADRQAARDAAYRAPTQSTSSSAPQQTQSALPEGITRSGNTYTGRGTPSDGSGTWDDIRRQSVAFGLNPDTQLRDAPRGGIIGDSSIRDRQAFDSFLTRSTLQSALDSAAKSGNPRALQALAGIGGALDQASGRLPAQDLARDTLTQRGELEDRRITSGDRNATLDRNMRYDLTGLEEGGRNRRAALGLSSDAALQTQRLNSASDLEDKRIGAQTAIANGQLQLGHERNDALTGKGLLQSTMAMYKQYNEMSDKDPKKAKLWDQIQQRTAAAEAQRSQYLGQGQDDGQSFLGKAQGGIIPPTMPEATAETNEYRNYAMASKALGAQPVPFDQFASLRAAARLQTQQTGAQGYAEGGAVDVSGRHVRGPGTGTSDSIPAVINGQRPAALSDGEFVIPEAAVRAKGTEFFEKLIAPYINKE